MDASLINPFVDATLNVLRTMAQTDASVGKPFLKRGNVTWGEVTGIIGMASEEVNGNMVVSFDAPAILKIVSAMLMERFVEIDKDVVDAVGEITNMICGGTKKVLAEQGYAISMASPLVVTGKDIKLSQLGEAPVISIPFSVEGGRFVVEANLQKRS